MNKFIRAVKHPKLVGNYILKKISWILGDRVYLQLRFYFEMGYWMDFNSPKTFNEKLQWLKIYKRNPQYTMMVDKVKVKDYVARMIGKEYIIPTLGIWRTPNDIDFNLLPNKFVLKCNHNSGGLVICRDKFKIDTNKVKTKLQNALRTDWYRLGREWPYKNVERCIIAEQLIEDENIVEDDLFDYKVFCFNGKPEFIQVDFSRFIDHKRNLYDINWNLLEFEYQYKSDKNHIIPKPQQLQKLLELSSILSKGFPFLRTDFYLVNEKIYFGEITFYPEAGFGNFYPKHIDMELGKKITLAINN